MTTRTYAQLGVQTTVQDADLLATYRGAGPLKSLTALRFKTYVGTSYLALAGGALTGVVTFYAASEGTPNGFTAEPTTGFYRSAAGAFDISILGTRRLGVTATGVNVYGTLAATALSGPLNGTVGATTPAAGAFTTLAASGLTALAGALTVAGRSTFTGYTGGKATKTANYTLTAADSGETIIFATNPGLTLTVPGSTLLEGSRTKIVNFTGGVLTVANGSGAVIVYFDSLTSSIADGTSFNVVGNIDKPYVTQ